MDDPYDFGRIAAANALSDVYAMGGTPISALNVIAYPLQELGQDPLREILLGGADVCAGDGVSVVGRHSILDTEAKLGLAVTGLVHPDEIVTNAGGRPGDVLKLTKSLGVGSLVRAHTLGLAQDSLLRTVVATMATTNTDAEACARRPVPEVLRASSHQVVPGSKAIPAGPPVWRHPNPAPSLWARGFGRPDPPARGHYAPS